MKKRLAALGLGISMILGMPVTAMAEKPEVTSCEHEWQMTSFDENIHTLTCTKCQETMEEEHTWDEGTVITEPTTTSVGIAMYTCTRGCFSMREIPKLEGEPDWAQYELEQKYNASGSYETESTVINSDTELFSEYKIWYPTVLKEKTETIFPVIVFANGTYGTYSDYESALEHLAAWGFIVIGNNHEQSGQGDSSSMSLELIQKLNEDQNSIFYGKADLKNVGEAGHSQGGAGAMNATLKYENSEMFRTIFTVSMPNKDLRDGLLGYPVDLASIQIPCCMVSGMGSFDSAIISKEAMLLDYQELPEGIPAVMAKHIDVDHDGIVDAAQGYMTAWFCYQLKGDGEAGNVFTGDHPELFNNTNWEEINTRNITSSHSHTF